MRCTPASTGSSTTSRPTDITRFQDELREHLRAQKDIYAAIREQGDLSDDKAEALNAEIEKVKSRFATSEDKAA